MICAYQITLAAETKTIEKTFIQDPVNHPLFPVFVVTAFAAIVLVLIVVVGIYMISVVNMLRKKTRPVTQVSPIIRHAGGPFIKRRKVSLYRFLGITTIVLIVMLITSLM